jgi:four helix bundle protein
MVRENAEGGMAAFSHRQLRVYAAAVDVSGIAYAATRSMPQRCVSLADQLLRACTSIVLNLAEGVAEFAPREKARFYRIARRSAAEASAAFDLLTKFGAVDPNDAQRGNERLEAIAGMLTRMIQAMQTSGSRHVVPSSARLREGAVTTGHAAGREPQKPAPETLLRNVSG